MNTPDKIVLVLPPLRATASGQLHLRVLDTERGRRLDIREFIDSDTFTGYTSRGIRLSAAEFEALRAHQAEIGSLVSAVVAGEATNVESGGPGRAPDDRDGLRARPGRSVRSPRRPPKTLEEATQFLDYIVDQARRRRDPLVAVALLGVGLGRFWTRGDARGPALRAVVELGRLASELLAEEGAG